MMGNIGTVAIVILFGIAFAMYVYDSDAYGFGFTQVIDAWANQDIEIIVNLIISSIINPLSLGVMGIALIASIMSGKSSEYVIAVLILVTMSQILFTPFAIVNDITSTIPIQIQWLVRGFFSIMMVMAVISFITGRDF